MIGFVFFFCFSIYYIYYLMNGIIFVFCHEFIFRFVFGFFCFVLSFHSYYLFIIFIYSDDNIRILCLFHFLFCHLWVWINKNNIYVCVLREKNHNNNRFFTGTEVSKQSIVKWKWKIILMNGKKNLKTLESMCTKYIQKIIFFPFICLILMFDLVLSK